MKAVVYDEYGPPEVLHVEDIPKPDPKDEEILVRVRATTVNFGDLMARNFANLPLKKFYMPLPLYFPSRLYFGWSRPKVKILGSEFSGWIESVGGKVKNFKKGDEVFGYLGQKMSADAEYLTIKESGTVGLKPENMTHEEAACIPYGMIMAYSHLGNVKIGEGSKVLVNGASGGIGSSAVQIARYRGAEVTGVSGEAGLEYVRSIGAEHVLDYRKQDFTKNGEKYDVIYDILGKRRFSEVKGSLNEKGTYLNASFKTGKLLQMMGNPFRKKKIICKLAGERQDDLNTFKKMAEEGRIISLIDRIFSLEEAVEAHRYAESGLKKGSIVISV